MLFEIDPLRLVGQWSRSPILAILRYQGRTSKTPLAIYQTVSLGSSVYRGNLPLAFLVLTQTVLPEKHVYKYDRKQ